MAKQHALVHYPGHLGPVGPNGPRTPLRDPTRGIVWDAAVKRVPEPEATDLVLYSGMHRALTVDQAADKYGITKTRLRDLMKSAKVTTAEYLPPNADQEKDKPETVLVLDASTTARLRAEVEAKSKES